MKSAMSERNAASADIAGGRAAISPQMYARTAGVLYLIVIVLGAFAFGYVPARLVSDDVAVTARNILSHESLWRAGVVADLIVVACAIPQLLCEYLLLRPVQRSVALLAVFFNLISLAIEGVSSLAHLAALHILKGASLSSVDARQLQAWAWLAIGVHDDDVNVSFLFFGGTCLAAGYLIFRSGFLPRFLGVLMTIAGLCYATNSLLGFLAPDVLPSGFPLLLLPAGLSELALCLWLLVKGVDVAKWRATTSLGGSTAPVS